MSNTSISSRAVLAWIAAVLTAGCVSLPPLPPQEVALPERYSSAAPVQTQGGEEPPAEWWRLFGDDVLNGLVAEALSENLSLKQAAQRIVAARALAVKEQAGLHPRLDGTVGMRFERQRRSGIKDNDATTDLSPIKSRESTSSRNIGLEATWEVPLFERAANVTRAAHAGVTIAEEEFEGAKVSLAAEVAAEYLALRKAQGTEALLQTAVSAQSKLFDLTTQRLRAGFATSIEQETARLELEKLNAELPRSGKEIAVRGRRLAILIGKPTPDPGLLATAILPEAGGISISAVPADLVRRRPDIRRAEAQVLLAGAELGIARANLYPRLTLSDTLTATRLFGSRMFDGVVQTIGIPALSIPLFDGGARQAALRAQNARLAEVIHAYRETVLKAYAEVEDALAEIVSADESLRANQAVTESAMKILEQTARLHARGFKSALDLIRAQRNLDEARMQTLVAAETKLQALVSLSRALGGADPSGVPQLATR